MAEFIGQQLSDGKIDKNIDKFMFIEYQNFIHSGKNWSKYKKLKNTAIGQMYFFLTDHYFQEKMQKFPDVDPYCVLLETHRLFQMR